MLFDLDGTLADSIGLILQCYRHTMRTHLGEAPEDALWLNGLGTPLLEQLATFARSAAEADAMRETYVAYQRTVHDDLVHAFPGACELIAGIEAAGIPSGLVTSKRPEMTGRTLGRCGLAFELIVTPDDVSRGKPDPEPVLFALERLGARTPARVLFVGDAPADILAGKAAGVKTAAVLWGPFEAAALAPLRPDYFIETIDELGALILGDA